LQFSSSLTVTLIGIRHHMELFRAPGRVTFLCVAKRKVTRRKATPERLANATWPRVL